MRAAAEGLDARAAARRKREIIEDRARQQEKAAAQAAAARNLEREANRPRIVIQPDRALINEGRLTKLVGTDYLKHLVRHLTPVSIGGVEFYEARQVVAALNHGHEQVMGLMGRFGIYELHSLEELTEPPRGCSWGGLEELRTGHWWEEYLGKALYNAPSTAASSLEEASDGEQLYAWTRRDGDPSQPRVTEFADALPIEFMLDLEAPSNPVVVYIRHMCELDEQDD
ncbi:MAG: hypothetical protein R6X33_00205 [Candidatus Brocadiia bacterium]